MMVDTTIDIKNARRKLPKELRKDLDRSLRRVKRKWNKPAIKLGIKLIDKTIEKGISPVESGGAQTGGKSRFVKYSESYREKIKKKFYPGKKLRPVNLELTGKMRRSLKGKKTKEGILLFYKDKKAKWHNDDGVGKSKVIRRMLPGKGTNENLSRTITKPLLELFIKIFRQI